MKKIKKISALGFIPLIILYSCSGVKQEKPQPVLGYRSVNVIEKHGLKFKDLNRNGKLDKYEDWRLGSEERSKDLLSRMSVEEKAGFMLINSLNMVGSRKAEASAGKLVASDLDESGGGSNLAEQVRGA
ncbi:MAG TPA: hypothetical protein VK207_02420, partial [Bacteroidales bacterium]|nr:hypothetical protein [Bacteroidales bacterium]